MDIQDKLLEYEQKLINGKRYIFFSDNWKQNFPNHSGVYVIWENEQPIYVGETSGLKSRMSDIMRPINHAFTKKISNKFNLFDLNKLRKFMTENYKLSFIQIELGRSEIEEYLILRWRKTLINKPTTRLLKGEQYLWVKAV
jgi:YHS domain-containing protein